LRYYNDGDYDTSVVLLKQASQIFNQSGYHDDLTKCFSKISNIYLFQGLYDSASVYLEYTLDQIDKYGIDDISLFEEIFYIKGNILNRIGDIDSAEYYLTKSQDYCLKSKNDSLRALVTKSLGNIDFAKGNYEKALDHYKNSLNIEMSSTKQSDKLIASLYQNMGIIYSITEVHDSAKIYFRNSINLKESLLSDDDPQLANGFLNYGRFLQTIGDQYEGLAYLDKAENIYLTRYGNDYFGLASIYFNKGSIYILLNDYDKSLIYHERAVELYKKHYSSEHVIFNELYNNIGIIYENLDKFEEAIDYYFQSLDQDLSPESLIKVYGNLGRCYYRLDDLDEAEKYYLVSIEKSLDFFDDSHTQIANSYLDYGIFCDEKGEYLVAENYLFKAYSIFLENFGKKNRDVSRTLSYLGQHHQNTNDFRGALNYYQKALVSFIEDYNEEDIYNNPKLKLVEPDINVFFTLSKKASAFQEYYKQKSNNTRDLTTSLSTCQLAIQLFEIIKSSYGEENTKLIVTTQVNEIYDLAVIVAAELYEKTKDIEYLNLAFEFSEKSKAAVLLSSLREFEAMEVVNIPVEIRNNEKVLNKEVSLYKKLVYDENQKTNPDSIKVISWKKLIFEKTRSHDSLIASIENEYPEYFNLKYNHEVILTQDIQDALYDNEAFIEYKIADSIIISFFITSDTTILSTRKLHGDFTDRIENYVGSINKVTGDFGSREQFDLFIQESHYLYMELIEPLSLSKDKSGVIIIPDDVLGYLNFETFIKKQPDLHKVDYKNLEYLINSHSISYGYSGTIRFQGQIGRKGNKKVLAMAPSYQTVENNNNNLVARIRDIKEELTPLDYTIEEVNRVISTYAGKSFIADEATEGNFKANAHNFNILHFAMHTLVNDDDPLASKLVFTLNNDTIEDGFLNTYEIYNLDLNAELAVLSACKTGVGKLSKGEGIMSLARSFMYAGVPGIVMTLWEIEDISSAEIMTGFYKNLKDGLKKDEALRNSKLSYLETANPAQSHPYFWAAYVQIGNNNPVITYSKYMYYIYAVILLSVIGTVYLLLNRRRKRN